MEIFIFIAIIVGAALLWNGYVRTKKAETDDAIDKWIPGGPGKNTEQHPLAKFNTGADEPWPFGEKLPEGKIHVKVADVAPTAPVPNVSDITAGNKAEAVAKIKKAPAKKEPAKKAAAKTPRKPKTS